LIAEPPSVLNDSDRSRSCSTRKKNESMAGGHPPWDRSTSPKVVIG
jgi:hypothetical protein